jgi:GT2 family glycosyltransferase
MKKISVIISCHKDSPYLSEAILSCLYQDFDRDDYEVILSSDGWEGARDVADKFGIECVVSDKKNHSQALNNAVFFASGEWVKECHYDDTLYRNCLSDLWRDRGGVLVYGDVANIGEGGEFNIFRCPPVLSLKDFLPFIKSSLHGAGFMFRRDAFLSVGGFDERLDESEEVDFYVNLLTQGYEFTHCPEIVAKYRKHSDSLSSGYDKIKRTRNTLYMTQKYSSYLNGTV